MSNPYKWARDDDDEVSVGKIVPWGGYYICTISTDVPEDEREEYARVIASALNAWQAAGRPTMADDNE